MDVHRSTNIFSCHAPLGMTWLLFLDGIPWFTNVSNFTCKCDGLRYIHVRSNLIMGDNHCPNI